MVAKRYHGSTKMTFGYDGFTGPGRLFGHEVVSAVSAHAYKTRRSFEHSLHSMSCANASQRAGDADAGQEDIASIRGSRSRSCHKA